MVIREDNFGRQTGVLRENDKIAVILVHFHFVWICRDQNFFSNFSLNEKDVWNTILCGMKSCTAWRRIRCWKRQNRAIKRSTLLAILGVVFLKVLIFLGCVDIAGGVSGKTVIQLSSRYFLPWNSAQQTGGAQNVTLEGCHSNAACYCRPN